MSKYSVLADCGTFYIDQTPAPGCTYVKATWPPRFRGRGESLTSPRRIKAKFRALEVMKMRGNGHTWASIAAQLGYKTPSGAFRAYWRLIDRLNEDNRRREKLRADRRKYALIVSEP